MAKRKLSTNCIHAGLKKADPMYGSVVPPIYPSSTFAVPDTMEGHRRFTGESDGMVYSRFTNPTIKALEERLAAVEETEMAIATSSGMSAIVITLMHFLQAGDSIIAHKVLYGGTYEFLVRTISRYGITVHFVDFNNIQEIEAKIDTTTKILLFESPTNPMIEIIGIQKVTDLAKKHNILTVFDNSVAPPPLQYPLQHGVDIVVYSVTKALNGHSDVIAGAILGRKELLYPLYRKTFSQFGPTLSPFAAYLIMRGMETLELRVERQVQNTQYIAEFLEKHPKIQKVNYPGLSSHPHHNLVKTQMKNAGSLFSFEVKGGFDAGKTLVESVQIIHHAVSLGSVESLIQHPASMTHSSLKPEERAAAGINESLIRMSVGIEDIDDLIEDLNQALEKIT